jgi:hypothetical protein
MENQIIDILMNSSNLTTALAIYILYMLKKMNCEIKTNSLEIARLKEKMIKK